MKTLAFITAMIVSSSLLAGCGQPAATAPSLGEMRPATGRIPTPGRPQATSLMNSSRMIAPTVQ
jgi:hypothetical protein